MCSSDLRSMSPLFNILKHKLLKCNRIILKIVDLMKELENQGLFRRYAHQDENKARIDEEAKLLDEAMQRFDVSFQVTFVVDSPHVTCCSDKHANQCPSRTTMHEEYSCRIGCR